MLITTGKNISEDLPHKMEWFIHMGVSYLSSEPLRCFGCIPLLIYQQMKSLWTTIKHINRIWLCLVDHRYTNIHYNITMVLPVAVHLWPLAIIIPLALGRHSHTNPGFFQPRTFLTPKCRRKNWSRKPRRKVGVSPIARDQRLIHNDKWWLMLNSWFMNSLND